MTVHDLVILYSFLRKPKGSNANDVGDDDNDLKQCSYLFLTVSILRHRTTRDVSMLYALPLQLLFSLTTQEAFVQDPRICSCVLLFYATYGMSA